ncbi:MAG: DUF2059 domain-containing protein [Burkholderiales bacterium]|nr:DUF2059 domain-containing protein [Burkholderiales bacterium]
MRILLSFMLATALMAGQAQAAKPTEASIKEVFALANTQALITSVEGQVDGMTKNAMQQALKDQPATPQQQKALDKFQARMMAIFKETMSWDKLEPMFVEIYSTTLTQEDVDGIIVFYKSPAGQSFISKMPVIMQHSMGMMQKMMTPMQEKIMQAAKEFGEEMDKLDKLDKKK